ncbi:zinc-dependent dehydrogenase [soil metagenome]
MIAAFLYGQGDLRVREVDEPLAGPGEIIMRTGSASVCGTDIRMLRNGHPQVTPDAPLIIGHEMAGTVEAVGDGVAGWHRGDRICVAPNYNPTSTKLTVMGLGHLDPGYRALGIHEHGAFAEYVRIPALAVQQGNVFAVPDGLSLAEAALAEPLACVFNAYQKARTGPGDTVLVVGAGPIGLMHVKMSRMAGAGYVILNDRNPGRLELARQIDPALQTVTGDPGALVEELTGGAGADVIITACPSPEVQSRAVELAAVNGRVIFFGGLPKDRAQVPLDSNLIHYRQIEVTGTTRQSLAQFRKTLDLLIARSLRVDDLITSTHPVQDALAAVEAASSGRGLKARIAFD